MSEWFLNPWSMLAGVLLVAVPVFIHLINRVRYKRVRWAAMEFLLKAQKRVRRKLLIQQLLLLLLRCLLVAPLLAWGGTAWAGSSLNMNKAGQTARR